MKIFKTENVMCFDKSENVMTVEFQYTRLTTIGTSRETRSL